jgi:hypothetical protein
MCPEMKSDIYILVEFGDETMRPHYGPYAMVCYGTGSQHVRSQHSIISKIETITASETLDSRP